jgi:regulator of protease activity HflC (stomatin/prohibitin superfamily)
MKKYAFISLSFFSAIVIFSSCTIVRPGQIGMIQRVGKLRPGIIEAGAKVYNPFVSRVIKVNVQTKEIYQVLELPTKEGLSVKTEIILLYHVDPKQARDIYINYGLNYQKVVVESNFIATARQVSARYDAKELYAVDRKFVEHVMVDELTKDIGDKGFIIDAVLLKEISLPQAMSSAIQAKANAEQAALQMEFVIQKAVKEADRLKIEAEGIKNAQNIINSSLTEALLKYNYIEMMRSLTTSPNAKIIMTDGKIPVMIGQ